MKSRSTPSRVQRVLVISLGAQGLTIALSLQRRLVARQTNHPHLAIVAIVGSGSEQRVASECGHGMAPDALSVVAVNTASDSAGLHAAVLAEEPAIVSSLTAQLLRISRLQPTDGAFSALAKLNPEISVVLVAALDDALVGVALTHVAHLGRQVARQRLNVTAQISGLLLLPDLAETEDPQRALAHCRAALSQLDRALAFHEDGVTAPGENRQADGWDPPFDQGCYLLGTHNAQGQVLNSADERDELAAEIMVHLTQPDLVSLCQGPLAGGSAWSAGAQPHSYQGIGLATWVYPEAALAEYMRQRMGSELLDAWQIPSGDSAPAGAEEAAAFWQNGGGSAVTLGNHVLSAASFDINTLWKPLDFQPSLRTAHGLRARLDARMADRMAALAAQRSVLKRQAAAAGDDLARQLQEAVDHSLDAAQAGRLPATTQFVAEARRWLTTEQDQNCAAASAVRAAAETIELAREQAARELDAVAKLFPDPSWRSWSIALVHPRRLLMLLRSWRELQRRTSIYASQLLRHAVLSLDVLKHDLVAAAYETAAAGCDRQAERLARLTQAVGAARQRVQLCPAPVGVLSFGLEHSVLTPETIEKLYGLLRGGASELLAAMASGPDRLSGWHSRYSDGEDMVGVVLDFTGARCAGTLQHLTADQLVVQALPDPRARLDALQALAQAASPFLAWDETRLYNDEYTLLHSCVVLGLDQGAASPLLDGVGEILFAQLARTGDNRRVTVLSTVQGLPLAALVGMENYSAEDTAMEATDHDERQN